MASNDFIIRIVLDAQSKIAPVFAAASAMAKSLEERMDGVTKSAVKLDTRMDQLEGNVNRASGALRKMNPTLEATGNKLTTMSGRLTIANRELGKVGTNAEKAAGGLAMLDGVITKLQKKLDQLDAKMTEMGARTYEPKMDVETGKAEAKVIALTERLAAATRGVHTAKTDVEIGAALAKVQALREELERIGHGARAERIIIEVNDHQVEEADRKLRRLYNTGKQHGPFLPDQKEIDQLLTKLTALQRNVYRIKTPVEADIAIREIERIQKRLIALGASDDANSVVVDVRIEAVEREFQETLKRIKAQAIEATKKPFEFRALLNRGEFNQDYAATRAQLFSLAGITVAPNVRLGSTLFRAERKRVEAELRALGLKRVEIKAILDYDRSKFDRFSQSLTQKANQLSQRTSASFSGLSTKLRDAVIGLAIVFAQPLLSAVTALAASLVSLGSAAGVAIAGLVGLANAAVFQALPGITLLVAGLARVASVVKVSSLAQAERDKGGAQSIAIDNARASALEGLANANRAVIDAQRGLADSYTKVQDAQRALREAQQAVTDARREGIRTLEDLDLAERRSALNAQKSRLGLASTIASGSGESIQDAQLDNEEAQLNANRQRADTRKAMQGGVEGLPAVVAARRGVIDAQRQLADALRGVEDAKRGVEDARRGVEKAANGVEQAGSKMGAAASAYETALNKLSDGERRLLRSIETFRKLFGIDSEMRGITDRMVIAFADGLDDVADLLRDNEVIRAFQDLSSAIGDSIRGAAEFLTTGPMRDALIFFSDEATGNLPIVGSIFRGLTLSLVNLARAASGPLTSALISLDGVFTRLADRTANNQSGLTDYFYKALEPIKAFLRFGGAVVSLFAALAGVGGGVDAGVYGLDRMTRALERATDYVEANASEVRKFLFDTMDASGEVLKVVIALGKALVETFDKETVAQFGQFLSVVVLPILQTFVETLGAIVHQILLFSNSEFGGQVVKMAAYSIGIALALGRAIALGALIFNGFARLVATVGLLGKGMVYIGALSAPIKIALVAIAGAVALLSGKVESLHDALKILVPLIGGLGAAMVAGRVLSAAGVGAAATASAGAGAAGAGAAGLGGAAALGGVAKFAGLLRTSVIAAVGFAAAKGLYTGINDKSVKDGVRDFASALTFGIVKSAKDARTELNTQGAQQLQQAVKTGVDPLKALESKPTDIRYVTAGAGGGAAPITTFTEGNKILASLDKLKGKGEELKKQLPDLLKAYQDFQKTDISKVTGGSNYFVDMISDLREFRAAAPREFTPVINTMIQQIKDAQKQWHEGWDKEIDLKRSLSSLTTGFGVAAQDSDQASKDIAAKLINGVEGLPKDMRNKGVESALAIAQGLYEKGDISKERMRNIRREVVKQARTMRKEAARAAYKTSTDVAANIGALANVVTLQMGGMVENVNKVLDSFGLGKISVKGVQKVTAGIGGFLADNADAIVKDTNEGGYGSATGGFVGGEGERGPDKFRYYLGRGEAVLNIAQQRAANAAMRGRDSLGRIFKDVKGEHGEPWAGAPGQGLATGKAGAASDSGEGINVLGALPGFAVVMAHFRRMFGNDLYVMSGSRPGSRVAGSGRISNHASRQAIDISNPVSNQGTAGNPPPKSNLDRLADYIGKSIPKPPRLDFLWRTTQGGNHFNHIHLGIAASVMQSLGSARKFVEGLPGASGNFKGVYSTEGGGADAPAPRTFEKLKTPDLGTGPMAKLAEAMLRKITKAGNDRMAKEAGNTGDSGAPTGAGGAAPEGQVKEWLTTALKRTGRFSEANLNALYGRTMQESGGNPKAINLWDSNAKAGHPSKGLIQTIDSTFQAYRDKKLPNDVYNPIANAVAAIRYMIARYGHIVGANGQGYASGGEVDGPGTGTSDSIPARLSKGEHVWTAKEVMNAGGHQAMRAMRAVFGGGGQSQSVEYKDGGEVKGFTPSGDISNSDARELTKQLTKVTSKLKLDERVKRIVDLLDEFTEGQLKKTLKEINTAISKSKKGSETRKQLEDVRTKLKTFLEDPITILSSELGRFVGIANPNDYQKMVNRVVNATKKMSNKTEKGLDKIASSLDFLSSDTGPFDQLEARIAAKAQKAARALSKKIYKLDKDGSNPRRELDDPNAIANEEISNLTNTRNSYKDERSSIKALMNKAERDLKKAKTPKQREQLRTSINNLRTRYETVDGLIADTESQIVQRNEQRQSDNYAATNSKSDRDRGWFSLLRRRNALGAAGGSGVDDQTIFDHEANITRTQLGTLNAQLGEARASGNTSLVTQIEDQINELNVSVMELAQSKIQAASDAVNKYAAQRMSNLDLQDRMVNLATRIGGASKAVEAGVEKGRILGLRGTVMGDQRAGLMAQRDNALAQGMTELAGQLNTQIEDLTVSMEENKVAVMENTMQTRNLATTIITTNANRATGLIGSGGGILSKIAEMAGSDDTSNKGNTLKLTGNVLSEQFNKFIKNIQDSINSTEFDGQGDSILTRLSQAAQAGPEAYAKALQAMAPEIAQFEATLGPEALTAFTGMVDGLTGNIVATTENTAALKALDGSVAQTFSSTAWTTFRQAIFTGNGGLLPQYDIPQMHTGGYVTKTGMFELEAGERVVTADQYNTGGDTYVDVNLTSPTEVADPEYLGTRIAWKINGAGRTN